MNLQKKNDQTPENIQPKAPKQTQEQKMKFLKSRGFKHGTMATVITICFVVGAILLNVIAAMLDERFPINIDLTSTGIYDLSDETKEYIANLDDPVAITILLPESYTISYETVQMSIDIIKLYPKYSNNISVSYVDTVSNPSFASNYPTTTLQYGDVLVESSDNISVVSLNDTINLDAEGNPISSKAETKITSSIMTVTSEEITTVGVISGHDETAIAGLTDMLSNNSFTVTDITIGMDAIDSSLDMLMICAPVRDYSQDEIKLLNDYLDNNGKFGKNVIYVADPSQPELANLDAFLAEWGIEISAGTVYENNTSYILSTTDPRYTVATIADTDYTTDYSDNSVPFFAPYSTPIRALFSEKDNRMVTTLATFSSGSAILPVNATSISSTDVVGPFASVLLGQKLRYDQLTAIYSSVMVFGSSSIFDSSLMTSQSYINADLTAGIFNTLAGREVYVNITAKEPMGEQIKITASTANTLALIFQYILPIAMLLAGVIVWLRRRHL